ncbi:hypothetical protein ABVN80_09610 [Acinetobacter baumannii]
MIALNAGAGIYVAGITKTYAQAVAFAQDIIYGGQALEKMSVLAEFTKTLNNLGRLRTSHDLIFKIPF